MRTDKVLLLLLTLLASPAAGARQPVPEDRIAGRWWMDEKQLTIEVARDGEARWSGVVREAARREEVGKHVLQRLVYDAKRRAFTGILLMPEDDTKHDVTVTLVSDATMKVVVRKYLLSKTIVLVRATEGTGGG